MLGDVLREARQAKGVSLAEAERGTRIRQKYLVALEDDNPSALPNPVYARGFLRNYALYLDLDPQQVVELFDEESRPTSSRIKAARGEPTRRSARANNASEGISIQPLSPEPIDTRVRYGSSYVTISLLALPLIFVFYFIYSVYSGPSRQAVIPTVVSRQPTVTALPSTTILAALTLVPGGGAYNTPTVYVPQTPGGPPPLPPIAGTLTTTVPAGTAVAAQPTPTIQAANSIVVSVVTTNDAWMRVLVDGVQRYSGTMAKGSSKQWSGKKTIRIRTGRADSVKVTVNGTELGFMGDKNSPSLVVEKEWDRSGTEKVIK